MIDRSAQLAALLRFWYERAWPRGWRPWGRIRKESDGALIVTLLDPRCHKHWLRVSLRGDVIFQPTPMICF